MKVSKKHSRKVSNKVKKSIRSTYRSKKISKKVSKRNIRKRKVSKRNIRKRKVSKRKSRKRKVSKRKSRKRKVRKNKLLKGGTYYKLPKEGKHLLKDILLSTDYISKINKGSSFKTQIEESLQSDGKKENDVIVLFFDLGPEIFSENNTKITKPYLFFIKFDTDYFVFKIEFTYKIPTVDAIYYNIKCFHLDEVKDFESQFKLEKNYKKQKKEINNVYFNNAIETEAVNSLELKDFIITTFTKKKKTTREINDIYISTNDGSKNVFVEIQQPTWSESYPMKAKRLVERFARQEDPLDVVKDPQKEPQIVGLPSAPVIPEPDYTPPSSPTSSRRPVTEIFPGYVGKSAPTILDPDYMSHSQLGKKK